MISSTAAIPRRLISWAGMVFMVRTPFSTCLDTKYHINGKVARSGSRMENAKQHCWKKKGILREKCFYGNSGVYSKQPE
jgi:hypothetical protein